MRVLLVTSEWPDAQNPTLVPFLVDQVKSLQRAGIDIRVFSFRGAKNPTTMKVMIHAAQLIEHFPSLEQRTEL
jgi:hypothetical protein